MDENKTTAPAPKLPRKKSLVWRIAPLVLAPALVAGSGVLAYFHFWSIDDQAEASSPTARSASPASEELKNLFAGQEENQEAGPVEAVAEPTADELFTGTTPAAEEPEEEFQPQVSTEAVVGDRYASPPAAQVDLYGADPYEYEPEQPPAEAEVTRGQDEAGFNPLRAATEAPEDFAEEPSQIEAASTEAAAMFGAATPAEPAVPTNPLAAAQPPVASQDRYAAAAETTPAAPPQTAAVNPFAGAAPLGAAAAPAVAPLDGGYEVPSPIQSQPLNPSPSVAMASPVTPLMAPPTARATGTGTPGDKPLEGAQSPSLTLQKLAPAEIQVGKECVVSLRVQNTGGRPAQAVKVVDEVPKGTQLLGMEPHAAQNGSSLTWDLGTLAVGEERTIEMRLMPVEVGNLGSVATVSFAAQATAVSRCTKPELVLRLSSSPTVHAGERQPIKIEISNPGSGDATGVVLLETLPAGVSHEAGPSLEFEVGTLAAGESRELELVLNAEQAGHISNVMTAQADANLRVEAACEFEVIAPALHVSVDGPQKRYLERPATYRVNIENPGTASAQEVSLVTHLPPGLEFVSANNKGEYDAGTHSVYWSLAELPAAEQGTVELVALPVESGSHTLEVVTQAALGLEDRTEKQVTVEGIAAVSFEVVDLSSPVEIGGETTYEIKVTNQGTKDASNVQIAALVPADLKAIGAEGPTRYQTGGQQVVFAPIARLAPKAEETFRIKAQGLRPGDHRLRVQITSDDVQQPIVKEVSTRVYADE